MGILLVYLGIFLVVVYVGFGLVLLFMQSRLLYRPVRNVSFTPADLDLDFEDVTFSSADGVRASPPRPERIRTLGPPMIGSHKRAAYRPSKLSSWDARWVAVSLRIWLAMCRRQDW
jgi:hypothetical protein